MHSILAWGLPVGGDWIVIAIVGLLLFGKRLPEVGKSLGKGIVEFKKGLKGIEDDVDEGVNRTTDKPQQSLPAENKTDYKFDPQTGQPINRELPPAETVSRESKPTYKFDPYTGQPVNRDEPAGTGSRDR